MHMKIIMRASATDSISESGPGLTYAGLCKMHGPLTTEDMGDIAVNAVQKIVRCVPCLQWPLHRGARDP